MNHKHRKTLHAVFSHPLSGNISIKDVEHVFSELGAEMDHGHGGKLMVKLAGHKVSFNEHSHSLEKDEVIQIRKYLETCGVDPAKDYPLA
ncbi:MAG: hypothetical protein EPO08_03710 [Rhodospirillaceae bacterium]|nr:MAG: hypothetical protein EPO08_03710 [Rhodospirillaceae bacterium]